MDVLILFVCVLCFYFCCLFLSIFLYSLVSYIFRTHVGNSVDNSVKQ
jgi:hypothetical protein